MAWLVPGVGLDDEIGKLSVGITQKQDMVESYETLMEQQEQIFGAILGLGVIIAIAVLFNTLLMNLAERDSELATLRVLGAPIRRIGTMMLGEHFAIGLIGGILACIFTIVATRHLISAMVQWSFYFSVQADPAAVAGPVGAGDLVPKLRRRAAVDAQIAFAAEFNGRVTPVAGDRVEIGRAACRERA